MIISNLRKVMLKYQIGALMSVMFMFYSCTKDKVIAENVSKANRAMTAAASITKEDLFKSIIFANGSLVDEFESLQNTKAMNDLIITDETAKLQLEDLESAIVADINQSSPDFLNDFKTEITSGDQIRIGEAIDAATDKMFYSFCKIKGFTNEQSDLLYSNVHALNQDDFVEIQRVMDQLNAGVITQEDAMAKVHSLFPNLSGDVFKNIGTVGTPPNQLACLAFAFVLVASLVASFGIAITVHTFVGVRYAVVYTLHIGPNSPYSGNNNVSLALIDELANYAF